jgi:hypothetical protein
MADTKISALSSASTPLGGTEVLPIVQSGTTVKVSVENVLKSTQPSGAANGVLYLNGSKIQSSGSTFQFDGTNVGLAGAPSAWAAFNAYQVGNAAMASLSSGNNSEWSSNTYFSAAGWRYTTNSSATHYQQFNGQHLFFSAPSGTAGDLVSFTQTLGIDASGNATVNTGNLVIGTSGKGIDFSATPGTGTSELLADYEEGTFTPVVADAATGGNTGTAGLAKGRYTKIGRSVTVTIAFLDINTTGMTAGNTLHVRGLPFTSVTDAFVNFPGASYNSQLASTNGAIYPRLGNNSTAITMLDGVAAGSNTSLTVAAITSGQTDLYVTLTYEAA